MVIGDVIHGNDRVTMVKTIKDEEKTIRRTYVSRVSSVKDDMHFEMLMPHNVSHNMDFAIGEKFLFIFQNEGSLYQSVGVVADKHRSRSTSVLTIRLNNAIEKIQRRQFFRVDCLVDIQYRYNEENKDFFQEKLNKKGLSQEEREQAERQIKMSPSEWRFGTAIDISGGGIRFNCREKLEKDTRIDIQMKMPEIDEGSNIVIFAKVVSSFEMRDRKNWFENRVEFIAINPLQREKIIRYVFEKDRINRKRKKDT